MMDYSLDRGLPASPDAERAILGSIILDGEHGEACSEAMQSLTAEHFFLDAHRRIYGAVLELVAEGGTIDPLMLADVLQRHKELEAVGGMSYLSSLTDGVPRRSSISNYIKAVLDKAQLRQLISVANGIISDAIEESEPAKVILAGAQERLLTVKSGGVNESKLVCELTEEESRKIRAEFDRQETILGLPTGIESLDKATGGLRESELMIFAGRPGSGKTHTGIQATLVNAKMGKRVHWFTMEPKRGQIMRRLWQHEGQIPTWMMRDVRKMWPDTREKLERAQVDVHKLGDLISIDDTRPLTVEQFLNRAVYKVKHDKVDLIVVDYAQLLVAKGKDEVERAIRQVQALTKLSSDYVPVLALAQLRRAPSNSPNAYPTMQDLKGSSQYEQDAAIIALIHRPIDEATRRRTAEDLIILDKMRDGEPDVFPVKMNEWAEFETRYEGSDIAGVTA